jgi:hypothetical protein
VWTVWCVYVLVGERGGRHRDKRRRRGEKEEGAGAEAGEKGKQKNRRGEGKMENGRVVSSMTPGLFVVVLACDKSGCYSCDHEKSDEYGRVVAM